MSNPFKKRATEFFVEDESFLAAITPSPINVFFEKNRERLFDRLVIISGTPGSGKTTLARLFQYRTIKTLLNHIDVASYREIATAIADCGMLNGGVPTKLTCRIPLTGEYRDFWELPYSKEIRYRLLESMLQARACLAWIQNLESAGHSFKDITIVPKSSSDAAALSVGVENVRNLYEKARQIELAIYEIIAALVPPSLDQLPEFAKAPYRPFDVIEEFEVEASDGVEKLQPLVVFDDAHELHISQYESLTSWLVKRELPIGRWIMTRLDALSPEQVLQGAPSRAREDLQRVQTKRDITEIRFQNDQSRKGERRHFEKMARDMSRRYISMMPVFDQRGITDITPILSNDPPKLTKGDLASFQKLLKKDYEKHRISENLREHIKQSVSSYVKGSTDRDIGEDVQLAMERILLHRYVNRLRPSDLFSNQEDTEPRKPVKCDSNVAHGAQIQLMHRFERAYYYGMSTLCDSGSNNAELFLQIAERLVEHAEIKIVRNQPVSLKSREQHRLLRQRGTEIHDSWVFPESDNVRALIALISSRCLAETLKANAPLGAGANSYGILQTEFDELPKKYARLARVLQFGIAYNAIQLAPNHKTKGALWYLFELGGAATLHYGLPFYRGGFVEGTAHELAVSLIG